MESKFTRPFLILKILLSMFILLPSCNSNQQLEKNLENLYTLFNNPPADAKPFVRWWWNGNCIEPEELERELEVMKNAGIGGVEINPIQNPMDNTTKEYNCYDWLSPEWNQRVKFTVESARRKNMIVDMIMGSGWPFGGEFLGEDEWLQGVGIRKITLSGPGKKELDIHEEWQLPGRDFGSYNNPDAPPARLFFLKMMPQGAKGLTDLIDLAGKVNEEGILAIDLPPGKFDLYIGTFQKAYRTVMFGAPGSRGPVVDHYDEQDLRAYMDKLSDALTEVLGGALGNYIRALFCDSIELSGANITDDFFEEFRKRRGYDLEPYAALAYYHPYQGYTDTLKYQGELNEDIRRIRYDFNRTLVELFQERFIKTFDDWANEHGMKSRYQAYGMPWLVGMLDGYRMVDIPESNNWLFSNDTKGHGFWIWNKYASSGAHLSGAPVVSCEAMTNTRGVFRTTLEMIKRNDDFNFITGINHSVLHGYNYSPPEAGFPGWVRFGAYFSDQNTWWPYFRQWADYNARLSALFQHTDPVTEIAILSPVADIWQEYGLARYPFYMNPWYHHDLWETFSQMGLSADYINEKVLVEGRKDVEKQSWNNGKLDGSWLRSGEASYGLVIVSGSHSILPETAEAMVRLASEGVKFVFIGEVPDRSPSFSEMESADLRVKEAMKTLETMPGNIFLDAPAKGSSLLPFAKQILGETGFPRRYVPSPADEAVYSLKKRLGNHDILFFSNQNITEAKTFEIQMADPAVTAWKWDPFTGERGRFPGQRNDRLEIRLQAQGSLLLVLEKDGKQRNIVAEKDPGPEIAFLPEFGKWKIRFEPAIEKPFYIESDELLRFNDSPDPRIRAFAGQAIYNSEFVADQNTYNYIDLGFQEQITGVILNGTSLGTRWWGRHLYEIPDDLLKAGNNELEIHYTTTLANYANSLDDNPVAKRWIGNGGPEPMGLKPSIRLLTDDRQ